MEAFIDYISVTEHNTLKTALNGDYDLTFPVPLLNKVMNTLSRFGCRQIPKPSDVVITSDEQVAKYDFCINNCTTSLRNSTEPYYFRGY